MSEPIIAPGGERQPRQTGGWASSRRNEALPSDWPKIRARVLKRDGRACQWPIPYVGGICGDTANEVDHRLDRHDHRLEALWALCSRHHGRKTQQEAAAGRKKR